ncbi:MAG TPA: class II histone deacetylase [Mycobacteriales bacterium]|jgi:acetoin utilization deacetylase AcuC-like enzyme|nr:class II histone deacetylase [Mycobacteriales bacterium]
MTTGYVYHEIFGWHDTGTVAGLMPASPITGLQPWQHFENAETKRRLHELIVVSGLIDSLTRIKPRPATETEILRIHDAEYVDHIKRESELPKGGSSGGSPFGHGGYQIACLAVGGVIEAVTQVMAGRVDNSYALVRPPGHHAIRTQGMGFCLFSNLAIAAKHAKVELGVERIAVVDWDVHHGNGTQQAFYGDPSVLTISLHQDNLFPPNSGRVAERGEGAGYGYDINVPLPPGTGDGGYFYAMDQVVVPAVRRFRHEIILVASGFDASAMDPLGRQMVTSDGYRSFTRRLMDLADEVCGGRIAMSHEGGYSPEYVPFCGLATIEALAGIPAFTDPFLPIVSDFAGQDLQPAQRALVDRVAELVPDVGGPGA